MMSVISNRDDTRRRGGPADRCPPGAVPLRGAERPAITGMLGKQRPAVAGFVVPEPGGDHPGFGALGGAVPSGAHDQQARRCRRPLDLWLSQAIDEDRGQWAQESSTAATASISTSWSL